MFNSGRSCNVDDDMRTLTWRGREANASSDESSTNIRLGLTRMLTEDGVTENLSVFSAKCETRSGG